MDNIFWVQRYSVDLFSQPLGEKNKSRKSLNEENMSMLYEELCNNLFIVNILFFICKSSYGIKDIDVTKHAAAMVVTASKTSKSYVINFIFNVRILHFCNKKVLQKVSNKHNVQHNKISKRYHYYSSIMILMFQKFQSFEVSKSHILPAKYEIWNILSSSLC